jgi:hypothetical protein
MVIIISSFLLTDFLLLSSLFSFVDRYKTLVASITFSAAVKSKSGDLFGLIVANERLGLLNCHLWRVGSDDVARLQNVSHNIVTPFFHIFTVKV